MRQLGILLSTPPEHKNRTTVVALANEAIRHGIKTYLYLIDDGVRNLGRAEIDALSDAGVSIFVCAYGAQRRGISQNNKAVFSGLVVLSNLIKRCDRFLVFN